MVCAECCLAIWRGGRLVQGASIYPPPPQIFAQKAFLRGKGGGCIYLIHFEAHLRQDFCTHPHLYTPPSPRRVFPGMGGGGV